MSLGRGETIGLRWVFSVEEIPAEFSKLLLSSSFNRQASLHPDIPQEQAPTQQTAWILSNTLRMQQDLLVDGGESGGNMVESQLSVGLVSKVVSPIE